MGAGLWVIPVAVYVLAFAKTWSLRESITETVWFGVAWMGTLAVIYGLEQAGYGFISTSPTGPGGGIALGVGFIAMWIRHRQWQKEKARRKAAQEAERARRAAAGEPAPSGSLITDAFRFAGTMQRNRRQAQQRKSQESSGN